MGTKSDGARHQNKKQTPTRDAKPAQTTGVFINSICTSSEPLIRETNRIKVDVQKDK